MAVLNLFLKAVQWVQRMRVNSSMILDVTDR